MKVVDLIRKLSDLNPTDEVMVGETLDSSKDHLLLDIDPMPGHDEICLVVEVKE